MRSNQRFYHHRSQGLCFATMFKVLPFLSNHKIGFFQVLLREINGLSIAIEEVGQSIRDVFSVESTCFGIAENGAGKVAGRDDDETA